jgi:hypothetical protein
LEHRTIHAQYLVVEMNRSAAVNHTEETPILSSRSLVLPFYDPLWFLAEIWLQYYCSTVSGAILIERLVSFLERTQEKFRCRLRSHLQNPDLSDPEKHEEPLTGGGLTCAKAVMWLAMARCGLAFVLGLVSAILVGHWPDWLSFAWTHSISSHLGAKAVLMHEAAARARSPWRESTRVISIAIVIMWACNVPLCLGCLAYPYLSVIPLSFLLLFSRDERRTEFGLWPVDPAPLFAFLDWTGSICCYWTAHGFTRAAYVEAVKASFTDGLMHLQWYVEQFPAHWRTVLWVSIIG